MKPEELKIGVVGACGSGKSELVSRLKERGYDVHHIAQEHSHSPSMWQKLVDPDILIYLEISFSLTKKRKGFDWKESEYLEQQKRLDHAFQHADLYIDTDFFKPNEILAYVLDYLETYPEQNIFI